MAVDIIYSISEHIAREISNHPGLKYSANMTTNGYLLDLTTARRLTSLGVRLYQISLDGDQPTHDQSRRKANGKGSYDHIWERLLRIRDSCDIQAQVMLRIHFSPESWQQIFPLLDRINYEFAEDPRFTVYFKSIERLGGPFDELIRTFTEDAQEQLISHFQSRLKYSRMVSLLQHETDYVCYAAKANSIAIRATGEIAKCTVALRDERNNIGKLNKDGSMEINTLYFRKWLTGLRSGSESDLACPYGNMRDLIRPNEIGVGLPIGISDSSL